MKKSDVHELIGAEHGLSMPRKDGGGGKAQADGETTRIWKWLRTPLRCLEIENARDAIKRLDDDKRTLVSIEGASNGLSKAVGEPVRAPAVLALPGWYVERRGRTEMWVMNGKEVSGLVRGRSVLNDALIERVIHQLDQRCRDVEF